MNPGTKNKLLTWLVIVLLLANAATITMFWLDRKPKQPPMQKGTPQMFLVDALKLDEKQQKELEALVKHHQQMAAFIRNRIKVSKEDFFHLLKQPTVTDSAKQRLSMIISLLTQRLDILTLEHFQKVRALCTPQQQIKFDEIIDQVTEMMGQPRPPMGLGQHPQGPPPERGE